jgi:hypothetical protein
VKGSDIQVSRIVITENSFYPLFHFTSSLIGKRECEYIKCIHPVGYEVSNSGGKHFGFSASRTGNDHEWTIDMHHGLALPFVQIFQVLLHGCKLMQSRATRLRKATLERGFFIQYAMRINDDTSETNHRKRGGGADLLIVFNPCASLVFIVV